jgi:signal transduction histidine kinase
VLNASEAVVSGARVHLRAGHDHDSLTLSVADSGRGMAAEVRGQAVQPFFTTKPKGMGLGLAMADKVARAHGGALHVDSAPGKGTTVTLRIPAAERPQPEETWRPSR